MTKSPNGTNYLRIEAIKVKVTQNPESEPSAWWPREKDLVRK